MDFAQTDDNPGGSRRVTRSGANTVSCEGREVAVGSFQSPFCTTTVVTPTLTIAQALSRIENLTTQLADTKKHHADQLRDISKDNETQIIAVRDEFQTLLQKMRDELAQERSSAVSQLHPQPELLDGESRRPAAQPNAANSGPPPHPPSATPCGFGTTDASTPLFGLVGPPPISASSAFGPTTVNGPPTLSALPSYGYRPPEINAQSGQHVNNAPWSYPANNHPHHTQQAIPHSGYAPPSYFGIAQTAGGAAYNAFIAMSNANAAAFANTMQSNNNMNSLNNMFNANYALFNAAMNNNHR
jgi:hypothetical protein